MYSLYNLTVPLAPSDISSPNNLFNKPDNMSDCYYGTAETPFGPCFLATVNEAIVQLAFIQSVTEYEEVKKLLKKQYFPEFTFSVNPSYVASRMDSIFSSEYHARQPIQILLKGTDFQRAVWQALLRIPFGTTTYYEAIAQQVGLPRAVRAVATQIANNRIAYLVPCHRVISKSGKLHNYRWGKALKQKLLDFEKNCQFSENMIPLC